MPGMDPLAMARWSANLLDVYESRLRFAAMCNRDYEGDVTAGGSVKIFTPGEVTPATYTRDTTTIAYERVKVGEQMMNITKRSYFALKADDLEKAWAFAGGALWQRHINRGSFQLAKEVDTYIGGTVMKNAVPTAHRLTPRTLSASGLGADAYELVVDMMTVLEDADVPMVEVNIVVPPALEGLLRKDARYVGYNTTDARRTMAGQPIGEIDNVTILKSTNTPVTSGTYTLIMATKAAVTFADMFGDLEEVPRDKDDFENRIRSQLVYDAYAVLPNNLVSCDVQFA